MDCLSCGKGISYETGLIQAEGSAPFFDEFLYCSNCKIALYCDASGLLIEVNVVRFDDE